MQVNAEGKVTGVELVYVPIPSANYQLVRVELIDEIAAMGNTVASYDVWTADGIQAGEKVWLAWVFPDLSNLGLPGNPDRKHMITNGYNPPVIGPLAMFPGDKDGNPIGDVIGGLGLPGNRHVGFQMTWRERTVVVGPEPDPDVDPAPAGTALASIAADIKRLVNHLGA